MKNKSIVWFLVVLSLAPLPGHAAGNVLASYAQWKELRDQEAPLPVFTTAYHFLKNHPDWPQERIIRSRAEAAALLQNPTDMAAFCTDYPPISGRGMLACVAVGAGDAKQRQDWQRQAWHDGDFNDDEEKRILATYRFTPAEHRARLDRLLYESKIPAAKRMLPRVAPQYQLLAEARIALMTNAHNAIAKLSNVPKALRNDPGLTLNRIEWRAKRDLDDGVVELLLQAPANPPYADRWWNVRASAARQALRERKTDAALKILARHGDLNSENMADALFLQGWIRMEYKHDMRTAYKDFYALYKATGTPVSKSRAAYWAARAAAKNGNADIAKQWYGMGARFPTVFYGQLSQEALSKLCRATPSQEPCDASATIHLPTLPAISETTRQQLANSELAQIIPHLTTGEDKKKMLPMFLKALTEQLDAPEQLAAVGELATKYAGTHGGVKVAKHALRKQVVLLNAGWPMPKLPDALGTEPALALAIIRQESEFQPLARSSADARGLMQILPATGKQVAKKLSLPYHPNDLWDSKRNVTLGSTYLGKLVQGFDGSYILAIASYNAGPGSVRKWLAREGWPPKDEAGAVNWVESIPYAETRNYVMRVLENLQIYRQRLNPAHPLDLAEDLVR